MSPEETPARPYELQAQSTKALLQRLYRDITNLVLEEVELAKVEIHERLGLAVTAMRGLVISAACAFVAMASLSACAIAALAYVAPVWLAALVVGLVALVAALGVAAWSRQSFAAASEPLRSTIGTFVGPPAGNATPDELRSRLEGTRKHLDGTLSALERKTDLVAPMRDTALGLGSLGVAMSSIIRSDNDQR
jgi:uncharacterized membrane protein YqjE